MAEILLGLIGPAIQSGHQSLAAQMQWLQFQDAKRRADKNERFAMATRSDAYGNKQKYDELNNEWSQTLTPLQAAILKAGEKEQYLTVTEDAQRNREIKRAAADRGKEAGKDYKRVLADFRYNQPKGEATIQNELNAISGSTANADAKSAQAKAITAALRAGQGALIPTIIKKTDDAVGAQTTDRLLKTRQMAVQEGSQRQQQHQQMHLPQLQALMQIMDAGGGAPPKYSDLPQTLGAQQSEQSRAILSALQQGDQSVLAAGNAAANAMAKSPDFRFPGINSPSYGNQRRKQTANAGSYNLVDSSGVFNYEPSENSRLDFATTGNF